MADVINFHTKTMKKSESHSMSCTKEAEWLVWCCHECSRKFKTNLTTHQSVVERKGNLYAHHTYHPYQPSKEEMEKSGLPASFIDTDITFT